MLLMNEEDIKAVLNGHKTQFRVVVEVRTDIEKKEWLDSLVSEYSKYDIDEVVQVSEKLTNVRSETSFELKHNIFLKITNVRVEKLQNISDMDIRREDVKSTYKKQAHDSIGTWNKKSWRSLKDNFKVRWNKGAPKGYKFEDNPYVFVYDFIRVGKKNDTEEIDYCEKIINNGGIK